MPLSLINKMRSGYIFAFLFLMISYFIMFFIIQKLRGGTNIIEHTYSVVNKLEELKGEMVDVETGARGYVITKDARFLNPYNSGKRNMPLILEQLKELTADNKEQQNSLSAAEYWIKIKMDYMTAGITAFQVNGFTISEDMSMAREPARKAMDSIRMYIAKMKTTEENLMNQRKTSLARFFDGNIIMTGVSLVIVLFAVLFSWITYKRENQAKLESDKNMEQYRKQLEENIAELQRTNTELKELKSLEKFTATGRIARTMAHEVRNPLTNISLAVEQLQEMATQNTESADLLDMVSRNAGRINQLVSDLLDATRFVQLEFTDMNINQVIEETLDMAKDRIELKRIRIEKKFSKEPCIVSVDAEKMKLALLNIIVNAIEAMEKDKGVLKLISKKQGDKCIIEIKDNGIGMDEDTLQKLFEPYFTGKSDGNGLGLTNTQNIILNHKGNIKTYSKPGHGASFIITLNLSVI
ncbi:MAG TPA: CHASE3 domain-containing protein [Chitinophagaceae bacterium]|nr:CHASE3 domain-containing protein [Chitinophagaceae bacterium]